MVRALIPLGYARHLHRSHGDAEEYRQVYLWSRVQATAYLPFNRCTRRVNDYALPESVLLDAHAVIKSYPVRRGQSVPVLRGIDRSEEHTSELQSRFDLVCRLLLEKKKRYLP